MGGGVPDYRRNRVAGGTYFFTVALRDRSSSLLVTEVGVLRAAVREVMRARPFHVDAWVALPEHVHCVWTLPAGDDDYSWRWAGIKRRFSQMVAVAPVLSLSARRRREAGVWQRRFWEHTVRDERDYAAHVDYVHFNPVRHGLVRDAAAWPYSSFRRCVMRGMYPADWAPGGVEVGDAGERG